jgi:hypothetical protein
VRPWGRGGGRGTDRELDEALASVARRIHEHGLRTRLRVTVTTVTSMACTHACIQAGRAKRVQSRTPNNFEPLADFCTHARAHTRIPTHTGRSCFPLSPSHRTCFKDVTDQLNVIFDVCGTPTPREIESLEAETDVKGYLQALNHVCVCLACALCMCGCSVSASVCSGWVGGWQAGKVVRGEEGAERDEGVAFWASRDAMCGLMTRATTNNRFRRRICMRYSI